MNREIAPRWSLDAEPTARFATKMWPRWGRKPNITHQKHKQMKTHWNEVRLGELLLPARSSISLLSDHIYSQITIRINHKGIQERGKKIGSEIGSNQFLATAGQFIISRIDARNGAMGIVPEGLNGAIVTNDFLLFDCQSDLLDPNYLNYLSQTAFFDKECQRASEGTTNRVRLQLPRFYNILIPLPPLDEQQRIVAKLDAVKTGLTELEQLRARQNHDIKALLNKLFEKLFSEAILVAVGEVLIGKRNNVSIEPTQTYQQITVRMDHKGVVLRQLIKGSEVGSAQLLTNENDFIISKIDARNGAMGLVPADLDGGIVTNDFPLYSFSERIRPGFFSFVVNTRYFDEACKNASEGTTNRKRLKTSKFESILIPLPALAEQDSLLQLLNILGQLQAQQVAGAGLMAQLMPSLLARAFTN